MNNQRIIKLTSPEGVVYFDPEHIFAISETKIRGANETTVKCQIHILTQQEPFNVLETVEEVLKKINN